MAFDKINNIIINAERSTYQSYLPYRDTPQI